MKIYMAGNSDYDSVWDFITKNGAMLQSYFNVSGLYKSRWKRLTKKWRSKMPRTKNKLTVDLFLDSGAFSAFTQKVEIDIKDYIKFIKKYEDIIGVYANLDAIGDAEATLKNQRKMEKAGLKPIPCFHYGEPIEYLTGYVNNYDYIALGGMVPISSKDLTIWLDTIFSAFLTDDKGMPLKKIHGFGLTSFDLLYRYPWYSVDSTSWVVTARMGRIIIPVYRGGKFAYTENAWKVGVSTRDVNSKDHFHRFSIGIQNNILDYMEMKGLKMGESSFKGESIDYELQEDEIWAEKKVKGMTKRRVEVLEERGVSNDYKCRDLANIIYYLDLEKNLPEWPWAYKSKVQSIGFGL